MTDKTRLIEQVSENVVPHYSNNKEGLAKTYQWIESEMSQKGANLSRFTKS